jgi:hypothetical protein
MVPSAAVSEHARYRRRLGRLRADDLVDTVARVAAERGWVEPGTAGRRVFSRFEPGDAAWATLLYRFGPIHVRVDAFDGASALRYTRIEDDGVLAGLGAVIAAHPEAVIIRYRAGRRCVLRIGERYVKLVSPELGVRLDEAGRQLWKARAAGHLPFRVAKPDRWDGEHGALWQGVVAGRPITPVLGSARGRAVAGLVGAALGALATAPVEPWQQWSGEQQWARTERAASQVTRRVPELGDELADVLARLRGLHDRFAPRAPVPVHGAASPDQWLDDGSTLGLVDFDRFAWSDPELDIAGFLGPLDFEVSLRGSLEDLETALLDGLRQSGFVPDVLRCAAYRVDVGLRKVARTAMAVRPDGDERVARHLQAVAEMLRAAVRVSGRGAGRG